ncbi:MAG: hypothetical protein IAE99_03390 [Rhodothermales bacterium]|nr:hypothetical protein [Rhodothermales bacterium]
MRSSSHRYVGAATVAAQTVLSAGLLFWTYRYVNRHTGAAAFGVWATVINMVVVVQLAEGGMGNAILRKVALYRARGEEKKASRVLSTGVASAGGLVLGAALLIWKPLTWWVPRLFDPQFHTLVQALIPWSLVVMVFNAVGMALIYAFDVAQRSQERAFLYVCTQAAMAAIAVAGLPHWGVKALLLGQAMQSVSFALLGWGRIRRWFPGLPLLPRWHWAEFREMAAYGLSWQGIAWLTVSFDVVMRALLVRFGGPELAGQFEYASKVVLQIRNVGVTALQTWVPRFTYLDERQPEQLAVEVRAMDRLTRAFAGMFLPVFWLGAPLLAALWQTPPDTQLTYVLALLSLGWSVNILSTPLYLATMGQGRMAPLVRGQAATLLVGTTAGWVLGLAVGGLGVVAGYVAAYIAGAFALGWTPSRSLDAADWGVASVVVLGTIAGLGVMLKSGDLPLWVTALAVLGYIVLFFLAVVRHPAIQRWRQSQTAH